MFSIWEKIVKLSTNQQRNVIKDGFTGEDRNHDNNRYKYFL